MLEMFRKCLLCLPVGSIQLVRVAAPSEDDDREHDGNTSDTVFGWWADTTAWYNVTPLL